ncbi:TPA: ABC transporter ATP-binding protein, partial [Streptococcus agalactiae]|nr:ABC transporter ATP-binding protein [Streptococcus agalactiae]
HDRYFLDKVANKIIAFEDNDIREFFGNYTDYLDEKAFNEQNNEVISKKESTKTSREKQSRKRMSYFEKQEWATIEDDMMILENTITRIEDDMQTCGSDFTRLSDLQKELDAKNEALLEKYDRYEYLSGLDT